mmetsp:Transcript_3811/g.5924  ORF Transcript_3811/g.5924 Transcript_3811/m.5924 type:complete len:184 (+) Transcript_3811:104-655(+)
MNSYQSTTLTEGSHLLPSSHPPLQKTSNKPQVLGFYENQLCICREFYRQFRELPLLLQLQQITIFLVFFTFYAYCVFNTFSPNIFNDHSSRRLTDAVNCTPTEAATSLTTGAVIGSALVLGTFLAIGLSPIGPIAGGLFAANMGAGLASGSAMAIAQSMAMTGTAYGTGAAIGAATGATVSCA